ncbi:MAG: YheU family protein [Gammaproteobacteria bacterium]
MEVPWQELSPAALRGVIEAFVLREGTDYGAVEAGFEDKVVAVRDQIERGDALILFDPASRSVEIAPVTRLRRR